MKDVREQWYDPERKVAFTFADVTLAAQELARAHLCGPASAHYLAEALAAVALLGAETSADDEVVSVQMKCSGPLGGVNVECTGKGTLRGYTERKILDGFDGMGAPDDSKVVGERRFQVVRSVPGRVLSQGIAASLDEYLSVSLQRRARIFLSASVSDEVEVLQARGLLVEALPDSGCFVDMLEVGSISASPRNVLSKLGFGNARLKKSEPMKFACRCSPERAVAMLGAMGADEIASLPDKIDITCHMCGKTYTLAVRPEGKKA